MKRKRERLLNLADFTPIDLDRLQAAGERMPRPKVPRRLVVGVGAADAFFAIFGLTRVKGGEDGKA